MQRQQPAVLLWQHPATPALWPECVNHKKWTSSVTLRLTAEIAHAFTTNDTRACSWTRTTLLYTAVTCPVERYCVYCVVSEILITVLETLSVHRTDGRRVCKTSSACVCLVTLQLSCSVYNSVWANVARVVNSHAWCRCSFLRLRLLSARFTKDMRYASIAL